jgi:hypothetical protein
MKRVIFPCVIVAGVFSLITLSVHAQQPTTAQRPGATGAAGAAAQMPAMVIEAVDSPVKISRANVLTIAGDPSVLLYAATNQTDEELEQFTVIVFFFDGKGILKTEQIAPGRRTLEAKSTKYSTIVLDGGQVDPAGSIVIGVNQAQQAKSGTWWRTDLKAAAEAAVPRKKP